jgi:hypothetical protein
MTRMDVIQTVLKVTHARRYLEIGVNDGECFNLIEAETKIAVDPHFRFRRPVRATVRSMLGRTEGTLYFKLTSDEFFAHRATRVAPFGVVFVDGLHTYEQAYRDVVNALAHLAEGGAVVVHDCSPATAAAAAPSLEQAARMPGFVGEWNGDVYRAVVRLRTRRDLRVAVLDCDQGVGIVRKGPPDHSLDLSAADVERLTFDDLAADRERLLGLRAPEDLERLLRG